LRSVFATATWLEEGKRNEKDRCSSGPFSGYQSIVVRALGSLFGCIFYGPDARQRSLSVQQDPLQQVAILITLSRNDGERCRQRASRSIASMFALWP
jgi:hypothetical protein